MKEEYGTVHDLNLRKWTIRKLYHASNLYNCTPEEAIGLIVEEWADNKEDRRLKIDSESSSLDSLARKVESVDSLVDELILKLKRASL